MVESKSSTETTVTISAQVENLTIIQICLSIISTLIGLTFICYKFKILCFRKKVEKDSDWIEQRELGFEKQRSARRLFPNHRVYPDLDQIHFDAGKSLKFVEAAYYNNGFCYQILLVITLQIQSVKSN